MKKMMMTMVGLAALAGANGAAFGQDPILAGWDFTGFPSGGTTMDATLWDAGLNPAGSAITRGSGVGANNANNSFRTTNFGNSAISVSSDRYFQVTLPVMTGYTMSLSQINARCTGTQTYYVSPGVTHQFAWSTNGTTFTLIGPPEVSAAGASSYTFVINPFCDLSGVAGLQNVPAGTTVTLRYFASGQTATGGWGFYSNAQGSNGLEILGTVAGFAQAAPPVIDQVATQDARAGELLSVPLNMYTTDGSLILFTNAVASGAVAGAYGLADGVFTYTPDAADAGTQSFTVTATNVTGAATMTFDVDVTTLPPFFEDFETKVSGDGAYAGATVTFASGPWYIAGYTTMDANDRRNGTRSVRLRDPTSCAEMSFDKPNGAGTVSFRYGSYSSHSGGKIQLQVSADQGASWQSAGGEITVPSWTDGGSVLQATNITVSQTGLVRIRIQKTNANSSNSVNIDDIGITDFDDGSPTVTVSPSTTNVLAGTAVTANVTAADKDSNPLAVTIADDSGLAGYTFAGGVFTWLADTVGVHTVCFAAEDSSNNLATTNKLVITVTLPVPDAPAVDKTTPGSIYLSWDPVPGATAYSVRAYKIGSEAELFAQDFSDCTDMRSAAGTTIGVASGTNIAHRLSSFGLDGWAGSSVYCAYASNTVNSVTNYMVKLGVGSGLGWIQTPPMDLSANDGECTLTVRAGAWNSTSERTTIDVLHIYDGGNTTNRLSTLSLSKTAMAQYTVAVANGTEDSSICFTAQNASNNRFFLDDVRLYYVTTDEVDVPGAQILVNGTTARIFGLPQYSEYFCSVTAIAGEMEETSPEVAARTTASTVIIFR